jgi:hypothetical protein
MSEKAPSGGSHLTNDIDFIKTPKAAPGSFDTGEDCGVKTTNVCCVPCQLT